jgi:putative spermidine/putrescine transport system permease protein
MQKLITLFNRHSAYFQVTPLMLILGAFLIVPLLVIFTYSFYEFTGYFTRPAFELTAWIRAFTLDITYLNYWATIKITAITWAITLVIGFTLAYFFVFDILTLRFKIFLFLLTVVPFWTSGVVRMIAWLPFLGKEGIVNSAIMGLGLSDQPLEFLIFSEFAVIMSYVHMFTLFMVAPLFNVMARIDRSLLEAARDQGSNNWQILTNIIIPLSRPGIIIGTIFVTALVASDFTAIRFLGGGKLGSVSMTIANQYNSVQFPFSAANGLLLLVVLLLFVGGMMRVVDIRKQL